ncbi:MAG: hypothetical protein JWP87_2367 [Labilithrix sp.]|nr:hypothetical protein [Labilithrix sp.]
MFGPRHPFQALPGDGWEDVAIDEAELRSPDRARGSELAAKLKAFAPDLLVVDMFWAPLRHVLPLARCEAWLLLRSFPPAWLQGPLGLPFDWSQYARIVSIEPVSSGAITHRIDPIVTLNPDERMPKGALRRRLGVASDRKLVAVMHAGNEGEHASIVARVPPARPDEVVVTFDLFARDALFPIAAWLGDCDALHCAAGYNSFWEAQWLGYANRTTFTPFLRSNDDQAWRIGKCARYPMRENGADTLAGWIVRQ